MWAALSAKKRLTSECCWCGCWLGIVCGGLILAAGCANQIENTSQESCVDSGGMARLFVESAKVDLMDWPGRLVEDSRDTFSRSDNLCALLLAGWASVVMHNTNADRDIAEDFDEHAVFDGFADESLNVIGSPVTHLVATGLWYTLSVEEQDGFNRERAWTMMTALSVTGLVTAGLKFIRDNETPSGGPWAWPSGHTASSFTVASVLDEFYGPKVGIPAYGIASLVACRMMDAGDHWASDVVFGATLGCVVGHTIAAKHKKLELAGFEIVPHYVMTGDHPAMGVSLVKQF